MEHDGAICAELSLVLHLDLIFKPGQATERPIVPAGVGGLFLFILSPSDECGEGVISEERLLMRRGNETSG